MKKLFKKPVFWVILTVVICLIVARIIQVKNNLKKTTLTASAKLGAGEIAKAFFTEPIYTKDETTKKTLVAPDEPSTKPKLDLSIRGNIPMD